MIRPDPLRGASGSTESATAWRRLSRPKVPHQIARLLMRTAVQKGLGPGDRLAAEHEIIADLGAARASVREALRLLEAHGVIENRRGTNGGIIMTQPRPEQLASSLAMVLQSYGGTLRTVHEARRVMAPTVAALAARRSSALQISELRDCITAMREHIDDEKSFHRANRRFHDVVAEAAGNVLLSAILLSLTWMTASAGWTVPREERERVTDEKAGIADAIEQGDSWLAEERMLHVVIGFEYQDWGHLQSQPISWADVDELLESELGAAKTRRS
jgi:GntR family transcriptional repressor for pyruvate dehydrogenase complex